MFPFLCFAPVPPLLARELRECLWAIRWLRWRRSGTVAGSQCNRIISRAISRCNMQLSAKSKATAAKRQTAPRTPGDDYELLQIN